MALKHAPQSGYRFPACAQPWQDAIEGMSAIEEPARKIAALHAITDLTRGTTVDVRLISGG